jgi:large subunit ribosomal protein L6
MSKIGKKVIIVPNGVQIKIEQNNFEAKGPKGVLNMEINSQAKVDLEGDKISIVKLKNTKEANAIWGLTRSLVNNLLIGVSQGYEKKLELQGVGFRMSITGKKLVMALGFSHPVEVELPDDLTVKVEDNNVLSVFGIDKQKVGQFAANIRSLKEVEPYKGKGFRYQGEKVRRKVGKKAGTAK